MTLSSRSRAGAYVALTKPDVSFLVLITTAAGYYMGARGPVNWLHMLQTVFATMLIAAGTAALNHYIERESDRYMRRTASRPLPSGGLQPAQALVFGIVLSVAGAFALYYIAGWIAALLGVVTCVGYLFGYTPLKKRTVWATFVGAFPGAIPPMIGWVAATGSLDRGAWLLFAILFLWQFPHFHAIAWMYREDYARAGILMLPVVDPDGKSTARRIMLYSLALIPISLMPKFFAMAGTVYLYGALALGLAFLYYGLGIRTDRTRQQARRVLLASVVYLPALFSLMLLDRPA